MLQSLTTVAHHASHSVAAPQMDAVMVFGFLSMFLGMVFFIHHRQSRGAVLGLAACLLATSAYGFLQGAWPVGMMQLVWAIAMLRSWRRTPAPNRTHSPRAGGLFWLPGPLAGETRMAEVFGMN